MPDSAPAPLVLGPAEHSLRPDLLAPEALEVIRTLHRCRATAYLCGGGVRDLLLGREPKDFDVVTDARPERIKHLFRNARLIGRRFRLAHVIFRSGVIIETATFRALLDAPPPSAEAVPLPSRRNRDIPDPRFAMRGGVIVRDNVYGTPDQDARRRDFTVNALFYDPDTNEIFDYVGGIEDLGKRLIRVIGEPAVRFHEDPVRMLRAVRIAGQLGFEIEETARAEIVRMHEEIRNASPERMHEEMLKIFNCGSAQTVCSRAWNKGLFQAIYPAFSAWLESAGAPAFAKEWMERALHQFDVWKKAGLKPQPALQYALLFGPMVEERAAQLASPELPPPAAAELAVEQIFRDKSNLPQLTRAIVCDAQRIFAAQPLMAAAAPGQPGTSRIRRHHALRDALVYLKFSTRFHPDRAETFTRWTAN